ncbi:MAG: cupin [Candidatus Levybacteria bacterium]|nr:cupin [Candidatus Levybacteria bacterium]
MPDNLNIPQFDKSKFNNDGYVKRVEKPWGYELHFVKEEMPYMGKLMHINAGCRQSMQLHDAKQETYLVTSGRAKVLWENNKGEIIETELEQNVGFTTLLGQRHRLCGITDCDILEFSTPEMGTTWRLEDDYARPDETPEQRKKERGEK